MSAPQTNIEKQKNRHRGPLIGMAFVVAVAVPVFLLWYTPQDDTGVDPETVQPLSPDATQPTEGTQPTNGSQPQTAP